MNNTVAEISDASYRCR